MRGREDKGEMIMAFNEYTYAQLHKDGKRVLSVSV